MISAVITAGGNGTRTGYKVPKQFLTVYDIPIIVYTIKNISLVEEIEKIVVVVANGWQGFVEAYVSQYNLTKVSDIVIGGDTRLESLKNGIKVLIDGMTQDEKEMSLIGLYDGNRPMIPKEVSINAIKAAKEYGAVVALEPCYDTMYQCTDTVFADCVMNRSILYKGQNPEFFKVTTLIECLSKTSDSRNLDMTICALRLRQGDRVAYIHGSSKSFKITTADDIELFKAMVQGNNILN